MKHCIKSAIMCLILIIDVVTVSDCNIMASNIFCNVAVIRILRSVLI